MTSWLLLSAVGVPKAQWPNILLPFRGQLPGTEVTYREMCLHLRRNAHMSEQGARTDLTKGLASTYYGGAVEESNPPSDGYGGQAYAGWAAPPLLLLPRPPMTTTMTAFRVVQVPRGKLTTLTGTTCAT